MVALVGFKVTLASLVNVITLVSETAPVQGEIGCAVNVSTTEPLL